MDCTGPGSSIHEMSMCSSLLPSKNTGIGCHFLLRIFPNQRSNFRLYLGKRILYSWPTRGAHFYTYSTIKDKTHCLWIYKGRTFSLLFLSIHNCNWRFGSFLTFAGWNCSVHSHVYRGVCPAVFCVLREKSALISVVWATFPLHTLLYPTDLQWQRYVGVKKGKIKKKRI